MDDNYKVGLLISLGSYLQKLTINKNQLTTQVDLSAFPAGLYLIKIQTKTGIYQYRIVKE